MTDTTSAAKMTPSAPVTIATLPERLTLRSDMSAIYSGRRFIGLNEHACHYRATIDADGAIRLDDATEAIALELVERSRRKIEEVERGPIDRDRSNDAKARAALAEMVRTRSLTSLGTLRQRGVLNARQFLAGLQLIGDIKISGNAHAGAGPAQSSGRAAVDDRAFGAVPVVGVVRDACLSLPDFEGVRPWSLVEDILVRERTMTEAAGGTSRSVQRRAKEALRRGLDAIADVYEIPVDFEA